MKMILVTDEEAAAAIKALNFVASDLNKAAIEFEREAGMRRNRGQRNALLNHRNNVEAQRNSLTALAAKLARP